MSEGINVELFYDVAMFMIFFYFDGLALEINNTWVLDSKESIGKNK